MAQEVWRADALRREAAEDARGREQPLGADGGGLVARQGDGEPLSALGSRTMASGRAAKKNCRAGAGPELVDYLQGAFRVSIRRGCALVGLQKSTYYYRARLPPQAALRLRIREIAETRVRYGYRRIHVLLRREGWAVNAKRVYRPYVEEGLQIRNSEARAATGSRPRRTRNARSPRSCGRTGARPVGRTMSGRWTSCRTSSSTARKSEC